MKALKSPKTVIFLTVFIDLVGFGIIIPLSPFLSEKFGATPLELGWLMAIYSVCQFIFSPIWGRLSDRFGRRPIILISLLGGGFSYLAFAFASSMAGLFAARAFAGIFGGNISTAHAYIADITSPADRSKSMGLLGAAFGLGFILGPALGAAFGYIGGLLGTEPPLGMSFSAVMASAIVFVDFFLAWKFLKESLPPELRQSVKRGSRVADMAKLFREPIAGPLAIGFFITTTCMSQMEAMLFKFMSDLYQWDYLTSSLGFALIGVVMVLTQGVWVRKMISRFGDGDTLLMGLAAFSFGLVAIPLAPNLVVLSLVMFVFAVGNGFMRPPTIGLISVFTGASEQGMIMGVVNSLAAVGRIIGPILGGYLYQSYQPSAPFFVAGMVSFFVLGWYLFLRHRFPKSLQQRG